MATHSFDDRAATWDDDPAHVERARGRRRHDPRRDPARSLDAPARVRRRHRAAVDRRCATTSAPITLADTSAGMREVLAAKVDHGVLAGRRVWDVDLSTAAPPDEQFDLLVTVLALHHIVPLEPVLAAFAALLRGGGRLCIVDFEEEDGSFHGDGFDGHQGFARPALTVDARGGRVHRRRASSPATRSCGAPARTPCSLQRQGPDRATRYDRGRVEALGNRRRGPPRLQPDRSRQPDPLRHQRVQPQLRVLLLRRQPQPDPRHPLRRHGQAERDVAAVPQPPRVGRRAVPAPPARRDPPRVRAELRRLHDLDPHQRLVPRPHRACVRVVPRTGRHHHPHPELLGRRPARHAQRDPRQAGDLRQPLHAPSRR